MSGYMLYDFPIVNCPFLSRNIPENPAPGVFDSQLIRYARGYSKDKDVLFQSIYSAFKVISFESGIFFTETYFRNLYDRHINLVHKLVTSVSHNVKGLFTECEILLVYYSES